MASQFDVLHFHIDQFHFPVFHDLADRTLTRLHGRPAGTVYHGLPTDLLTPTLCARGGYLAFLERISPEKRVDRAIKIASAFGLLARRED
jgi:hypothetical protein